MTFLDHISFPPAFGPFAFMGAAILTTVLLARPRRSRAAAPAGGPTGSVSRKVSLVGLSSASSRSLSCSRSALTCRGYLAQLDEHTSATLIKKGWPEVFAAAEREWPEAFAGWKQQPAEQT